jgi:hypothetical protein
VVESETTMLRNGRLRAWIEPREGTRVVAAFVGAAATAVRRPPATQLCASCCEARRWVAAEATAIGTPVEWVAQAPDIPLQIREL